MIKFFYILNIIFLFKIDAEVKQYQKSCLSKTFSDKEPVSFGVKLIKGKIDKKKIILNVETRDETIISHYHQIGIEYPISFNSNFDSHLFFCVDNLSETPIRVQILIKSGVLIGHEIGIANDDHTLELETISSKTRSKLNTINKIHEIMVQRINKKTDLHFENEKILTTTGFIMLIVIILIGVIQIIVSKKELSTKKLY